MKEYISKIKGQCHCGNIWFEFYTNIKLSNLPVRRCQCEFCKLHGAATARDPNGTAKMFVTDLDSLKLYRFATESTEFVICKNCGVYVGAVLADGERKVATLNMNLTELITLRHSRVGGNLHEVPAYAGMTGNLLEVLAPAFAGVTFLRWYDVMVLR